MPYRSAQKTIKTLASLSFFGAGIAVAPEKLAVKPEQWQKVLTMAKLHRVQPMVLAAISALPPNCTGPSTNELSRLALTVQADRMYRMVLTKALLTTTTVLQSANIPSVGIKGPAVSCLLYNDPVFRQYRDVDLLIPATKLEKAVNTMKTAGFSMKASLENSTEDTRSLSLTHKHHLEFYQQNTNCLVEIHPRLGTEWFTGHGQTYDQLPMQTLTIENQSISTLRNDYLYQYLIHHGTRHKWTLLHWVVDIGVIFSRSCFQEQLSLFSMATSLNQEKAFLLSCKILELLSPVALAPEIVSAMNGKKYRSFVTTWANHCLNSMATVGKDYHTLTETVKDDFYLSLFDTRSIAIWFYPIRFIKRFLAPSPTDLGVIQLPKKLWFLYTLFKPAFVVYKRGRKVTARLRKKFSQGWLF